MSDNLYLYYSLTSMPYKILKILGANLFFLGEGGLSPLGCTLELDAYGINCVELCLYNA